MMFCCVAGRLSDDKGVWKVDSSALLLVSTVKTRVMKLEKYLFVLYAAMALFCIDFTILWS